MYAKNEAAFIERFALWDGPALLMLLTASSAMAFMLIKLTRKVCCRSNYEPISDGFGRLLSISFRWLRFQYYFSFLKFQCFFIIYTQLRGHRVPSLAAQFTSSVFFSLWSTTSGLTLIVHVFVARGYCRKRKHKTSTLIIW